MTINNIALIVTALAAIASAYFAYRAVKRVETVHVLINSRMTELLDVSKELAKAQGVVLGRAEGISQTLSKMNGEPV
ncbi:MAG: hypothetical protein JWM85_3609 [Acidimicrobiaceae bacterium]|nr:hypothetical protein [Acidimicrobiaceae bacterium]